MSDDDSHAHVNQLLLMVVIAFQTAWQNAYLAWCCFQGKETGPCIFECVCGHAFYVRGAYVDTLACCPWVLACRCVGSCLHVYVHAKLGRCTCLEAVCAYRAFEQGYAQMCDAWL